LWLLLTAGRLVSSRLATTGLTSSRLIPSGLSTARLTSSGLTATGHEALGLVHHALGLAQGVADPTERVTQPAQTSCTGRALCSARGLAARALGGCGAARFSLRR